MLHAPEIEQQETFIHTREGDEVEVTCIVHAHPPATVEWYMNGQKLERDNNVIYNRKGYENKSVWLKKYGFALTGIGCRNSLESSSDKHNTFLRR